MNYGFDDCLSLARSAARAFCKSPSMYTVIGCAPPSTRRAIRSISSSVVTASRRSSSVRVATAKPVAEGDPAPRAGDELLGIGDDLILEPSEANLAAIRGAISSLPRPLRLLFVRGPGWRPKTPPNDDLLGASVVIKGTTMPGLEGLVCTVAARDDAPGRYRLRAPDGSVYAVRRSKFERLPEEPPIIRRSSSSMSERRDSDISFSRPSLGKRRSSCLAELIDGLKLKPAQAESLEQLLDEHEVHDLATAQILDAEDFKEIGIKVGTRKKLLERLASSTSEA